MENLGYVQMVHGAHAPKLERQISLDDWLCDGELDRIAREREGNGNGNSNGNHSHWICSCDETLVRGRRIPRPPGHSCEWVKARNALIPEAERIATEKMGCRHGWTREFVFQLDRLCRERLNA